MKVECAELEEEKKKHVGLSKLFLGETACTTTRYAALNSVIKIFMVRRRYEPTVGNPVENLFLFPYKRTFSYKAPETAVAFGRRQGEGGEIVDYGSLSFKRSSHAQSRCCQQSNKQLCFSVLVEWFNVGGPSADFCLDLFVVFLLSSAREQ
jgi:hypothetical protein